MVAAPPDRPVGSVRRTHRKVTFLYCTALWKSASEQAVCFSVSDCQCLPS